MAVDLTDPVSTANASAVSSNIKNFSHAPDLILNAMMTDMLESQRSSRSFNQALLARATRLVLDDSAEDINDIAMSQVGAKIAQTTPPDTSGQIAMLAAQVAALTQIVQSAYANSPTVGTQAKS